MGRCKSLCLSTFMIIITIFAPLQIHAGEEPMKQMITSYSPFPTSLETLQKQLDYTFRRIDLLRRAMTHASYSEENNRALSILGTSIIETSVSLRYLRNDIDISSKALNLKIAEISNVESSCAVDGMTLGLHKVVRVSHKTNSTSPAILCGAFRAIFGAIALDNGESNDAETVFWNVHTGTGGVSAERRIGGRLARRRRGSGGRTQAEEERIHRENQGEKLTSAGKHKDKDKDIRHTMITTRTRIKTYATR